MSGLPFTLMSADELRAHRADLPPLRVESRWYYAKKAVPMFPGVGCAVSGAFLAPYYRRWEAQLTPPRVALNAAVLQGFRAWVPTRAAKVAARYGFDAAWEREATARARRLVIDPYELAAFRIGEDAQAGPYLRSFEWARMHRMLVPQSWQKGCRVGHKIAFYLDAMAHGLPIPPMRAVVEEGQPLMLPGPASTRLICKPENGRGGRAIFILEVSAEIASDPHQLGAVLAADSRMRTGHWIVQDHIAPHPDLAPLALDALPTLRIISILDESGTPHLGVAYLRIARSAGQIVDNTNAGGLRANIPLDGDQMEPAVTDYDPADYALHPASGERIAGRAVPFFREACALAVEAHHRALSDYALIGWDIAVTANGPVIIEANAKPSPQGMQMALRKGIGDTRFGAILAQRLEEMETAHG